MKCSCTSVRTIEIDRFDLSVASLVCPCGQRENYYRLDNGKWESESARQKRLNKYHLCDNCGAEFIEADHAEYRAWAMKEVLCPKCMTAATRRYREETRKRNHLATKGMNKKSPWRMGVRT